jgi:crotonobetainyl-CoA:carnitine CoA-transferase CaiB-like acyl-CoA transferase
LADQLKDIYPERARGPTLSPITCYGEHGPWHTRRRYERQAQAVVGVMDLAGDLSAVLGPYNLVDIAPGVLAAFGTGLAVYQRKRTGESQRVATSLAQAATHHLGTYLIAHARRTRTALRGWDVLGLGPLNRFYQGSDREWLFLGLAGDSLTNSSAAWA